MSGTLHRIAAGAGIALTLTVAPLAAAGPAQAVAGSAYISGSTLYYVGQPDQKHSAQIKLGTDGRYHVTDWLSPLVPSASCPAVTPSELSCDATGVTSIVMIGGNLMDNLGVRGTLMATMHGGEGDDTLLAGDAGSVLSGGPGDDTLIGGPGPDTLDGGPGDDHLSGTDGGDTLIGGPGADTMAGGEGADTASYAGQAEPVVADADDAHGDDGAAGERDSIAADVERLAGGTGDDQLSGGPGDQTLVGGPGDDTLVGGAGSDRLDGGAGFDLLYGDAPTGTRQSTSVTRPDPADHDICLLGVDGGRTAGCEVVG